jgi:hypothetical protein
MTLSTQQPEVDKVICCVTGRTMFQTLNVVFIWINPESTEAGQTTSQFSVTIQKWHKTIQPAMTTKKFGSISPLVIPGNYSVLLRLLVSKNTIRPYVHIHILCSNTFIRSLITWETDDATRHLSGIMWPWDGFTHFSGIRSIKSIRQLSATMLFVVTRQTFPLKMIPTGHRTWLHETPVWNHSAYEEFQTFKRRHYWLKGTRVRQSAH